jgi:hypothetical protein
MRTSAPGQSALLMADVAEFLATQGVRYAVIDLDRKSLDLALLRRLAQRFGRVTAKVFEGLIGVAD